jgi:hypothetical protein
MNASKTLQAIGGISSSVYWRWQKFRLNVHYPVYQIAILYGINKRRPPVVTARNIAGCILRTLCAGRLSVSLPYCDLRRTDGGSWALAAMAANLFCMRSVALACWAFAVFR